MTNDHVQPMGAPHSTPTLSASIPALSSLSFSPTPSSTLPWCLSSGGRYKAGETGWGKWIGTGEGKGEKNKNHHWGEKGIVRHREAEKKMKKHARSVQIFFLQFNLPSLNFRNSTWNPSLQGWDGEKVGNDCAKLHNRPNKQRFYFKYCTGLLLTVVGVSFSYVLSCHCFPLTHPSYFHSLYILPVLCPPYWRVRGWMDSSGSICVARICI